jgi:dTDP-4-amino-4,6-dideoxygalactose transaminase
MNQSYISFGKPNFSDEEIQAVTKVLRSGWVGMGPETLAFEEELAKYVQAPFVISVSSCTAALFLALLVEGIQPGDEVICPSLTWCSTADVILHLGGKVIFCDVDPNTLSVTPESIKEKLTSKTKAIMVVHYGGLAVDVQAIRQILPNNVVIIEDAAHAIGTKYDDGKPVGSSGNLTCFSFYANKNLSTAEGGAIALFDEEKAERLKALRLHGISQDAWKRLKSFKSLIITEFVELGYKMNYTDLQACIGRIQLKRQTEFAKTRYEIANFYYQNLNFDELSLTFQTNVLSSNHSRHLFVIQLPIEKMKYSRNQFIEQLRQQHIGASIHYLPLHTITHYNTNVFLQNTEKIYEKIVTLPISSSISLMDADYIVKTIQKMLQN